MDFNPFKHKISDLNSFTAEKGNLLIAEPFMKDPYFKRSVVLLCEHESNGTVGLILNHPLGIQLKEVLPDFPDFDAAVFLGGPVNPQNLFFLHRHGGIPGSIEISKDLYWDGDFEVLKSLIQNGEVNSQEIRFFLGYSGWDFDQLQNEIEGQSWLINRIDNQDILNIPPEDLWKHSIKSMEKKQATMMADFPEDPSLN